MSFHRNPLAEALRYALAASAFGFAGLAAPAFAQDEPAAESDEAAEMERITVTGSRIRQADVETAQPVLVITRDEIEKQGFQSVADILQNISAAGSPAISRAQPLAAGENVGGQFIDLRNIGTQRTLVLVNGKRIGITTAGLQDISIIPASMIERVEVLKDGASSVYGSDAMGGVINLITRSGFSGLQVNAYIGQFSEGDGNVEKYDVVMGAAGERGSVTFGVEYTKEAKVRAKDRPFSAFPQGQDHPFAGWTPVGQFGGFVGAAALPGHTSGRFVLREGGNPLNPNDYVTQDQTAPNGQVSNTNQQTDLRTPLEQRSIFVKGDFQINDQIRLDVDALYSGRVASRQVAGFPLQAVTGNGVFNTPISVDSVFNPFGRVTGVANPQAINSWWRRGWEVPRVSEGDANTFRFTAALSGSFDIGDRFFDWDVSYLYNNNKQTQSTFGNFNLNNVRLAVGPSFINAQGVPQCGTPAAPIPLGAGQNSCVPFNPFLRFGLVGPGGLTNNTLLQNYLFQEEHATGDTSTQIVAANISGLLFSLPAGDLTFALGVETRKEKGEFIPDSLAVTGASTNLSSGPTRGGYSVDEVYGEFQVPLLADATFAKELSLSLSSRYSDYDTFGDTTNSKLGLKWKPIDDLLFRGTYAEGFRAPTIANLFATGSQTFSFFTDPCDTQFGSSATNTTTRANCARDIANAATFRQLQQGFVPTTAANAQTPIAFFSGAANPTLQPEESESKSLGLVYSPSWLEGFNMAIDWWTIEITDTIVGDSPTQILNDCYVSGITDRCSSTIFRRDPATGIVNFMNFGNRNAGYVETQGVDLELAYRLQTEFGDFSFLSQSTYTNRSVFKTTNDPAVIETNANGFGGSFRLRSNANIGWSYGDWGVSWGARYYSSIRETCLSATAFPGECSDPNYTATNPTQTRPTNKLGSNTFHDIQVRWTAPWDATISVGANNVFDHYGPVLFSQPSANVSYYGGFDIGRFAYLKYEQNF